MASFTKEVNLRLAKRPLKINGHLANRGLTSLVKGATGLKLVIAAAVNVLEPHKWETMGWSSTYCRDRRNLFQVHLAINKFEHLFIDDTTLIIMAEQKNILGL